MRARWKRLTKAHSFAQASVLRRFAVPFGLGIAAVGLTVWSVPVAGGEAPGASVRRSGR